MSGNTKILHLISADCDWEPAVRMIGLAAALREYGLASAVTAPNHSRVWEVAEAAGVDVLEYAVESSVNPFRWKELARAIAASGAGIVHTHDTESAALLGRARLFLDPVGVVTSRYDLKKPPAGFEYGSGVDAIICSSAAVAEAFARYKEASTKLHTLFDGVSIALADRALEERAILRTAYRDAFCPHKEKPLFLVAISPLEDGSGHGEILEAMTEIVAILPQTHLFIMGEGPQREELERQVKITALEKDVAFLEPDKAFLRLLAAADLYVAFNRNDVSGFMVQAAMAAANPAVLRNSGCYPELIEDGKCGRLIGGETAVAVKEALLDLLENRHRREQMSRLAKARADKAFNIADLAGRTAEIYGEIMAQKQARG
ncbi:MAG: glycosyltransferase family 4 protein [Planctomycetes bacterium]|nr:glycosyltransferase family 4 protein [Planctomycetota bacterium]